MPALARTTERDCYTRAANEDGINGGLRTRTKYAYDNNGNAITRNGYQILWSAANYPTSLSANNKNVQLFYGPNRQRYKQIYDSGSTIETTIYADRMLEKVTMGGVSDWRHYIRVAGNVIAIMSRQNAGNATRYVLEDQEGSLTRITDSSGASLVSESFTAFGARRDAASWSAACNCSDLGIMRSISRDGFTGEEAIGGVSMGLNHLNGRVQDAITGRFLSADPYVPHPDNTQSYNRFSYVLNNPVSLTDPSGFEDETPTAPNDEGGGGGSWVPADDGGLSNDGGNSIDLDLTVENCGRGCLLVCDSTSYCEAIQFGPGNSGTNLNFFPTPLNFNPGAEPNGNSGKSKSAGSQSPKKPTQCINADGSIGNDSPGNLPNGNLRTVSLNLEAYIGFGFTFQFGGFYDRTTGNYGLFDTFGLGGGLGGSGSVNVGTASNLSSFQGITGQVEGGVGPIAGTYVSNANNPLSPVGYSGGIGANLLGVLPVPVAGNVSKTFTNILTSNLPRCH